MAASDIFIKLDGIEGESQDSKHKGEIQVQTVSWGISNQSSVGYGGGLGSGKAQFQDLHFTKVVDKASPKLFQHCGSGKHISSGIITLRKSGVKEGQVEYGKITLSDLIVTNYAFNDVADGGLPTESVSLSYTKLEYEYKEQKQDGTLGGTTTASYDIKQNKFT